MKREFIEGAILVTAIAIGIYLTRPDKILKGAVSKNPKPEGDGGNFNWTEDDITYDDHLYKNADGLMGLKLK
jgi:hypothetical protein